MEDRNYTVDIAKGYGMILVIAGHLFTYGSNPFNFIFSFHMPLFFFLSGFLFTLEKYPRPSDLFKKVFRTMVTTYLFFIFIGFILYFISGRLKPNAHLLYSIFLKGQPDVCGSLWFITCLAIVYILFYFIIRKLDKNQTKWIIFILAVCLLLEFLLTRASTYYIPLKLESVPIALFFFTIGYYCRLNKWMDKVKVKWGLIALIAVIFFSYINSTVNICVPTLGNILYFLITAFGGICFILAISKYKNLFFIRFLGINSMIIFLMDEYIRHYYLELISLLDNKSYIAMENVPILYCLIGTVLVTLGCATSIYIISPLYTRFSNKLIALVNKKKAPLFYS